MSLIYKHHPIYYLYLYYLYNYPHLFVGKLSPGALKTTIIGGNLRSVLCSLNPESL